MYVYKIKFLKHRSSSATGSFFGEYVPKATSTTDLHTLNNNNSSGLLKNTNNKRLEEDRFVVELERKLVESTIQKIVQKELQKQADEDKKREGSFDKGISKAFKSFYYKKKFRRKF